MHPFEESIWCGVEGILYRQEIHERMKTIPDDYNVMIDWRLIESRFDHVSRIAWFAKHGWNDPVDIDFGCPTFSGVSYALDDGHHRLAAAIIRKDAWIYAVASGEVDYIETFLYCEDSVIV